MPTIRQACQQVSGLERSTFDSVPPSPPAGMYVVVSELAENTLAEHFRTPGDPLEHSIQTATVLLTLYGLQDAPLADLRPIWLQLAQLPANVTSHPGVTGPISIRRGPLLPPTRDLNTRRPWAAVRLLLQFQR